MEKKTRKKSSLITAIVVMLVALGIIAVIFAIFTYFMNVARDYDNKKYKEKQQELEQENAQRNDNNVLFKINDKYINQYGYIIKSYSSSAIQVLGINISNNQERLDEDSLELLVELIKLRETFKTYDVLDKVNKVDITNIDDVKIYMDSENKIIQIGNLENLSTKFVYIKNIMKQEKEKKGTIFVNDINKTYFREDV
ncbi:MAG: hypothetical protein V8R72_00230 [Clostridia bacterium]